MQRTVGSASVHGSQSVNGSVTHWLSIDLLNALDASWSPGVLHVHSTHCMHSRRLKKFSGSAHSVLRSMLFLGGGALNALDLNLIPILKSSLKYFSRQNFCNTEQLYTSQYFKHSLLSLFPVKFFTSPSLSRKNKTTLFSGILCDNCPLKIHIFPG